MVRLTILTGVVCLLLAAGCRQPQPDWAADADKRRLASEASLPEQIRKDQARQYGEDNRPSRLLREPASKWDSAVDWFRDMIGRLGNSGPLVQAAWMEDTNSADKRREAVFYLSDRRYGRNEPYTERYAQIAEFDPDPLVRSAAVRALNRARVREVVVGRGNAALPKSVTAIYTRLLEDKHELVRLEAAKALANIPDEKAAPALLKRLVDGEEDIDVRIAAADALRHYKTQEVAQALVRTLVDRNFSVVWQVHRSLTLMTGRDFLFDRSAWFEHLKNEKPFL